MSDILPFTRKDTYPARGIRKYNGIPVVVVETFTRDGQKFAEVETVDGSKPFRTYRAENADSRPGYSMTNWTVARVSDLEYSPA